MAERLKREFYIRNVLEVAPKLLGKTIAVNHGDEILRYKITEVEAYNGFEDKACHASKGRTNRTEIMFHEGGHVYMYLIYGMYWMLNIVTGPKDIPQAVLIRGIEGFDGPGKAGKALGLDKSFYGEDLTTSNRIWIEDAPVISDHITTPRIGIDYAGEPWVSKHWRWKLIG
ncbi:DNA-3-methyladenine glycosylase [Saccharicrinis sp. FJH2]|uniref:DNA-3-methyladenine glycosylase n=1 Tax=Saccharicrinis sp. FJH65 TaxID=3344659 RepID=UPI0035F29B8B